jgi:predicted enzyme related to lactoylglutathione lyase
MFLGLRTVGYRVAELERAKAWYSSILGFGPYFDEPFYVGFNVAGYELGLMPDESGSSVKSDNVVTYWGVENAQAAIDMLLEKGATRHEDVQDVGGGIRVATVKDPFGNVFGVIENPHFKLD